ncbi:preprotein translocase subunit Sec61beta [Candidatus Pacearchaeota archaeon]|nr:preprotein translocase subunit Sec61beta [Candidatus Pacearchaeota archaeon]
MAENKIQMPGVFGGLMRYDEEYESKFKINPGHVIAYVVALIIFVSILKIFS